ncbi:Eco57I restriction-modification methylase domain-containing protein [Marivivens marinus]|uniref:Eco57I restriction-modification methylase domain-containing protein n=1 Tax=Marivivens marinus TaxID=3110173 RepID=UPI003B8491A5
MQPLEKTLRNQLERTVKAARTVAEDAAEAALQQLGVGDATAFPHLSEDERDLRRRLRIHGRQLGDRRHTERETQELDRLIEEVGYEHWHRMLFARFLAENNLLMYPDPSGPVPVSLEECEDLAPDEGAANGWELAAQYAARMLPQIFRLDSPVFQLSLPPEYQQRLEKHVESLPTEVFTASDSLGWVYQFWQADNKERINKSEVKIGARELPAVTQLFTEPYMVSFLLDNALGAWWAARRLTEQDLKTATSEEELRRKASIPGVPLDYLRFVQDEDGTWAPAAGTFDGWPEQLKDLTTLDPCCGSGHFLVSIFLMLVPMRMERDGLNARDAVDAVLRENIHGLEIDQRCVELAAFALALTAWKYPGAGGYRALPELNLACSGLSVSVAKEEWKQLGLGKRNLTIALDWMHDTFRDAPVLGSLLNPAKSAAAKIVNWEELSTTLDQALRQEHTLEQMEAAVVAQGLSKAALQLAAKYTWVVTNVPYLGRGKQTQKLMDYCDRRYPDAKNDLATVFLDRCLEYTEDRGIVSVVMPQNWLFLPRYRTFRENKLRHDEWNLLARLGAGAFETISGEVVKAILLTLTNDKKSRRDNFGENSVDNIIHGVDVADPKSVTDKAIALAEVDIRSVSQNKQLLNPDARITLEDTDDLPLLADRSSSIEGLSTGDNPRFIQNFWESPKLDENWEYFIQNAKETSFYTGRSDVLRWSQGELKKFPSAHNFPSEIMNGKPILGQLGLRVTQMSDLPATIYSGEIFGKSAAAVVPHNQDELAAFWCFISDENYKNEVRRIDQKVYVSCGTMVKVPFDLEYWTRVAEDRFPNGLPEPYTDDPTQWVFHGHPCGSVIWDEDTKWTAEGSLRTDDTVLHVAVARLLGYRWPAELDLGMELADEQRAWVDRCDDLLPHADDDGIVCIPPIRGEAKAEDRLLNLLAAAYGDAWTTSTLPQLLASAGHAGKSLDSWLRDKFFNQHCKLFPHRPFIWHIWDGLKDGFAALVNYHKLDGKTLETLIYTYLGDWMKTQRDDIARGVDGAQEKLAAADALKKKLELILEGEAPHDIFVRWKPLEEQPIGWDPDLNDGVRLNIRPFMTVGDVAKRDAGVLRDKPNVKWTKDRGKDVASAPWFDTFNGDRINDHHLSLAEKKAAREAAK